MKIRNLLIMFAMILSVGFVVSCDSDNNTNAQEPGSMDPGPMAMCPCDFNQDLWTAMGWMTNQGGGLFESCATEADTIELVGGINNQPGNELSLNCINQIGTAVEMSDGSIFCEADISCLATNAGGTESVTQKIYFEKITITSEEQAACQSEVEDIAMTLGISCG